MNNKFKILLVDDDPDKRQLLRFTLELGGYEVQTANNGQDGLALSETREVDLVITDVQMPIMDGFEMARRIRANPQTRFIPIIVQSATRHEEQDRLLGAEAGALGYLTDPTDLDLLLARVGTLLDFKKYLDSCEEAAFTDHLTGLANRRRFERQVEREVERTQRYGRPFCLLMVDVDHFKEVNDTHGHEVGDEVLRRLGGALQAGTRGIDTAARIGGDEFAVILTETDLARGLEVAERLRLATKETKVPEAGTLSASFGLAEFSAAVEGGSRELFANADAALYEAKRRGRDCVGRAPTVAKPESNSEQAQSVT